MNGLVFVCLVAAIVCSAFAAVPYYSPYAAYKPYGGALRSYYYSGAPALAAPFTAPVAPVAPVAAPVAPAPLTSAFLGDYYSYAAAAALGYPGYPYGYPYLGAYSYLKK